MIEKIVFYFFVIVFILFSIFFALVDIKKRKLVGIKRIITFLIYLFFGISMSLMLIFININWVVSILIFLILFLICIISSVINKGIDIITLDLLILIIVGIICCICGLMNIHISNILWIILGLGIYLLPGLGEFTGVKELKKKMKRCTKKVDARIIDVHKGRTSGHHSVSIYVPKFEFTLDGNKYEFMDTSSIYSRKKFKVGDTIKLYVNPDNPHICGPNGCDDVFWPGNILKLKFDWSVIIFYISTILIFILVTYLNSKN